MFDHLFKKYRARITREGIIKSILCGIGIGSAVLVLVGFSSWFFGFGWGLYLAIALFVAVACVASPLFYFKKYRPTTKVVARRLDELGLEERMLTMVEFENDESYVAQAQRADAQRALASANHMLIKIAVSVSLCLSVGAVALCGIGTTTVSALYAADVIPSGIDLITGENVPAVFTVAYTVNPGDNGIVALWTENGSGTEAVAEQYSVTQGEAAPAVIALPAENWVFIGWSDGVAEPYRHDEDLQGNISVTALFKKLETDFDKPDNPYFEGPDIPPEDGGSSNSNLPSNGSGGTTMHDSSNMQIIDGKTYYGDDYEKAREDAKDRVNSDDNLQDDLKDAIGGYYDTINPGDSGDDGD